MTSQRTYDVIITSLLRQNHVATSFWRKSDVIVTSYVRWDVSSSKFRTTQVNFMLHLQAIAVKKDVLLTATWRVYKHVISGQHWPRSLRWRHNGRDSISNHQPYDCLFNRLFRRRSKKTSKLRAIGLCVGNSPGPVNSPHKGPVTRKMFPFDDVIMFRPIRVLGHPYYCTISGHNRLIIITKCVIWW